jgi:hypothetical protein
MRPRTVVAAAVACLLGCAGIVVVAPPASASADASSSWIVMFDGPAAQPAAGVTARAGDLAALAGGRVDHVYSHALSGFSFTGTAAAAARVRSAAGVARVVPDGRLHTTEIAPNGILRTGAWDAHEAGYTGRTGDGTKVRVAIVDTGIRSSHPDLAANVDTADGINCITPGAAPNDDHGHGTHVAGTTAAAFNGTGVVGVATDAQLVPVKVLDQTGFGTDSQTICGLDHVAALATDGTPTVVNMSLGDENRPGEVDCTSSPLHEAVCNLTAEGVTVVAAAGNSAEDAASFVPAAFPEVIAVSAFTDFDGTAGGAAGCQADFSDYGYECDDMLADFSNYGTVVDVTAPGVHVYSTWKNGGWKTISGSSMAAPHVAGAAALVLSADPTLTPAEVQSIIVSTGECPDGTEATGGTCAGHGQWEVGSLLGNYPDPDGVAEPLLNVARAAAAAGPPPPPFVDTTPPSVTLTAPAAGAYVRGTVNVTATASDDQAVDHVSFFDGATLIGTDMTAPYAASWDTTSATDGAHSVSAVAFDTAGLSTAAPVSVNVDNTAPAVTITQPATGTVAGTVSIKATATDSSPMNSVVFLVDGVKVAKDVTAPFATSWDSTTVADGTHAITARATDAAGNTSTSAPVSVYVSNAAGSVVMHAAGLTASAKAGASAWKAWATVKIVDQHGTVVSGATVTFSVTGGVITGVACVTGATGLCSSPKVAVPNAATSVTFTVTAVSLTGATWDGAGPAVTVNRPF